jgi:hypothetical protein
MILTRMKLINRDYFKGLYLLARGILCVEKMSPA